MKYEEKIWFLFWAFKRKLGKMEVVLKLSFLFIVLIFAGVDSLMVISPQDQQFEVFDDKKYIIGLDNKCKTVGVFRTDCNVCFCLDIDEAAICSKKNCTNTKLTSSFPLTQKIMSKSQIIRFLMNENETDEAEAKDFIDEMGKCLKVGNFKKNCNHCRCGAVALLSICTARMCPKIDWVTWFFWPHYLNYEVFMMKIILLIKYYLKILIKLEY